MKNSLIFVEVKKDIPGTPFFRGCSLYIDEDASLSKGDYALIVDNGKKKVIQIGATLPDIILGKIVRYAIPI